MKRADLIFALLKVPIDYLMFIAAGISAYLLRVSPLVREIRPVFFEVNLPLLRYMPLVFIISLWGVFIFALSGLYRVRRQTFFDEFLSITIASSFGVLSIITYLFITIYQFDSRFIILAAWPLAIIFVTVGRIFLRIIQGWLVAGFHLGVHRVLVVGDDHLAHTLVERIEREPSLGYRIVKHLPTLDLARIREAVGNPQIDEVILSRFDWPREQIIDLIHLCEEHQLIFKFAPNVFQTLTAHTRVTPISDIPIIELKRTPLEGWGKIAKRLIDLLGSVAGILIFAPLMALVALAIGLDSPGPIIYKNERVGPRRKIFTLYKFRSMKREYCTGPEYDPYKKASVYEDALVGSQSKREGPVFKIMDDPRRTRLGRFLEKTSLDELPQFLNVLKGEMSLVGPRPHMPKEVEKYERRHKKVFDVKPGITGLAQISGRSDLDFEDEIRFDAFYIENWSLILDVIILLKTPFTVLFKKHKIK